MSERGGDFAAGRCFVCGAIFTFDPDLVPSVFIDPETKRPPDLDERSAIVEPTRESLMRARREPLCSTCVEIANAARELTGQQPIPVLPEAYELRRTL